MRISKLIKSSPRSPKDEVVDWIEFVVNTAGAHHLKVEGETLWFYEFYNLDVFVSVLVMMYILYRLIKACTKLICKSKAKTD